MKDVFLVGATGSIGTQTLDVIREYSNEFRLVGVGIGNNIELGKKIIEEFKPEIISIKNKCELNLSYNPKVYFGDLGLLEVASYKTKGEMLFVNALVGIAGLLPTVYAIKAKKDIALANKETLVVAGDIINDLIKENGVNLLPIDSEHSAILECLKGEEKREVKNLIITASGGTFRNKERSELVGVTKEDALKHPNWSMGAKITIDSATMMNKGFEVIEAHYLFNIPYSKIKTVMHPESIVHSLVEYEDGVIKASLGSADMHIPIAYALRYPHHEKLECAKGLSLVGLSLNFKELSTDRFPCLGYAYKALEKGGIYRAVLNAANEAAVYLFLHDKIEFLDIEKIIYEELSKEKYKNIEYNLSNILEVSKLIMSDILERYGD